MPAANLLQGLRDVECFMRTTTVIIAALALLSGRLMAQERKPVPKDSVRVSIPGCTKGYIFTAGRRTQDQPGSARRESGCPDHG